jgi:hypothetical protein
LLVRSPQSVLADIVIDNADSGTSPGSASAILSGTWERTCNGGDYYTLRCASWVNDSYGVAFTQSPSATATFKPNIGLAGNYAIYEWHGRLQSGSAATTVSYTIKHAKGSNTKIVNQATNYGRWNLLGIYQFDLGSVSGVTISANGANGAVQADAIKFVHVKSNSSPDIIAPAPPSGVRVEP